MLSEAERRFLLDTARHSVDAAVRGISMPPLSKVPKNLSHPGGAFVTLRIGGELRGCIGFIESPMPLAETVHEAATRAAVSDFRFNPMTSSELTDVEIEISVLSPPTRIDDVSKVVVGTHGLIVEHGSHRGLLLPQVPVEQDWDRGEFISFTCRKAGLDPQAWKDPRTVIYTFTAEVFGEEIHSS